MKTLTYQQTMVPTRPVPVFDAPTWQLGYGDYGLTSLTLEEFQFPDRIVIVGTLTPHYVEESVTGCYQDDSGTAFAPVSLYSDHTAVSRIEWIADWVENPDGAAEAMEEPLKWGLDFAFQKKNIVTRYSLPSVEHPGFWNATQSTLEPVWSWGGVSSGRTLMDIKPRYFSLLPEGVQSSSGTKIANTKIAQVSSINPRYQVLCDASDTMSAEAIFQPMSLLNHIQFGSIVYFLPHVTDSVGYQSADVLDYDPQNGRVKILFLRSKHGTNLTQH
jgi:hypothetical protein